MYRDFGGFLNWAEDRIAKEYEQHLKMEKQCGKEELEDHYREVDKNDLVRQVNELRSEGLTVAKACEQVGISPYSYYTRNRKLKNKNKK